MAIESAVFSIVALALPVWLVVEELTRRERHHVVRIERSAPAPTATPVPASRAA